MIKTDVSELKGGPKYGDALLLDTAYAIVNLDNGKRYIGMTRNPKMRIKAHFSGLKNHHHPNKRLRKESNCRFGYEILEEEIAFRDRAKKEREYMLKFKTYDERYGYNSKKDPCLLLKDVQDKIAT